MKSSTLVRLSIAFGLVLGLVACGQDKNESSETNARQVIGSSGAVNTKGRQVISSGTVATSEADNQGAFYQVQTDIYQETTGDVTIEEDTQWADPNQEKVFSQCAAGSAVTAKDKNGREWGYDSASGASCKI